MNRRHWMLFAVVFAAAWLGFFLGNRRVPPEVPPAVATTQAPLIGIASIHSEAGARAVRAAGGVPVVLPNHDAGPEAIAGFLQRLDGLLLPGGADIPPAEYGEAPHPATEPLDRRRASFEKELGKAWIARTRKPLLGICLGSQWLGVLHGGTLVQDLPSERGVNHRGPPHRVELVAGTRLHGIYGEQEFEVNSRHHQAVDAPGDGLRVAARAGDGTIEAVEGTGAERFLIGVQWHPEDMVRDARQERLFEAFVNAAR